eukprot:g1414.t1
MDNLRELEEETEKAREKFDEMLRRLNPQKAQEHSLAERARDRGATAAQEETSPPLHRGQIDWVAVLDEQTVEPEPASGQTAWLREHLAGMPNEEAAHGTRPEINAGTIHSPAKPMPANVAEIAWYRTTLRSEVEQAHLAHRKASPPGTGATSPALAAHTSTSDTPGTDASRKSTVPDDDPLVGRPGGPGYSNSSAAPARANDEDALRKEREWLIKQLQEESQKAVSLQRKIEGRHDTYTGMPTSAEKREIARSISRAVLEEMASDRFAKKWMRRNPQQFSETTASIPATSEMPKVVSQSTKGSEWPDEILEQERILREAEEALNRAEKDMAKAMWSSSKVEAEATGEQLHESSSHSERGIYDGMDLSRLAEVIARDSSPSSPDSAHSAQDFINNFKETVMANVRASLSPLKSDAVSSANAVLESDGKQIDSESMETKKKKKKKKKKYDDNNKDGANAEEALQDSWLHERSEHAGSQEKVVQERFRRYIEEGGSAAADFVQSHRATAGRNDDVTNGVDVFTTYDDFKKALLPSAASSPLPVFSPTEADSQKSAKKSTAEAKVNAPMTAVDIAKYRARAIELEQRRKAQRDEKRRMDTLHIRRKAAEKAQRKLRRQQEEAALAAIEARKQTVERTIMVEITSLPFPVLLLALLLIIQFQTAGKQKE